MVEGQSWGMNSLASPAARCVWADLLLARECPQAERRRKMSVRAVLSAGQLQDGAREGYGQGTNHICYSI